MRTLAGVNRWLLFLVVICLADMVTTAIGIAAGTVTEANPLMARVVEQGLLVFCAVKLASFVPAIVLLEVYKRRNPRFVSTLARVAVLGYVTLYALGLGAVNLG